MSSPSTSAVPSGRNLSISGSLLASSRSISPPPPSPIQMRPSARRYAPSVRGHFCHVVWGGYPARHSARRRAISLGRFSAKPGTLYSCNVLRGLLRNSVSKPIVRWSASLRAGYGLRLLLLAFSRLVLLHLSAGETSNDRVRLIGVGAVTRTVSGSISYARRPGSSSSSGSRSRSDMFTPVGVGAPSLSRAAPPQQPGGGPTSMDFEPLVPDSPTRYGCDVEDRSSEIPTFVDCHERSTLPKSAQTTASG